MPKVYLVDELLRKYLHKVAKSYILT